MRGIKFWAVVGMILIIGSQTISAAPATPVVCVPVPTGRLPQQTAGIWRWSGSGSEVSDPFDLPAGTYRLSADVQDGSGFPNVQITSLAQSDLAGVVMQGISHGETLLLLQTKTRVAISVTSATTWTVSLQPLH